MKKVEFEFDNEMDAILKRAGGLDGPGGAASGEHPDADEIAAFSERALPEASLKRLTAHFADCGRCRRILASTFESPAAEVSVAAASLGGPAVSVPWYRQIFALPQLAAVMGILVIAFGALFVYVTTSRRSMSDMASAPQDKGFTPPNFPAAANSSNVVAANRPANPSVPMASANSNVAPIGTPSAVAPEVDEKPNSATSNTAATPASSVGAYNEPEPVVTGRVRPEPEEPRKASNTAMRDDVVAGVTQESSKEEAARLKSPNPAPAPATPNGAGVGAAENKTAADEDEKASPKLAKKMSKPGAMRTVGGRTFNNVGGIWFDAAYTKQPQTTVKRGTDDYRKLDAGLRAIADQLGGTVVVLWNGRAYRIQ